MIDLILLAACGGVFYAGFKAGNLYTTIGHMLRDGIEKLKQAL